MVVWWLNKVLSFRGFIYFVIPLFSCWWLIRGILPCWTSLIMTSLPVAISNRSPIRNSAHLTVWSFCVKWAFIFPSVHRGCFGFLAGWSLPKRGSRRRFFWSRRGWGWCRGFGVFQSSNRFLRGWWSLLYRLFWGSKGYYRLGRGVLLCIFWWYLDSAGWGCLFLKYLVWCACAHLL